MNKPTLTLVLCIGLAGLVGGEALGDRASYNSKATKYYSANGKYCLKVTPSKLEKRGNCKAELYSTDGLINKKIWSRYLLNDLRPERVLISNSGEYVATLDDYFEHGVLPIVIYGSDGRLIKIHSLESLGMYKDENIDHIDSTVEFGIMWAKNAHVFIHPKYDVLYVGLSWGTLLMIELERGDLMDADWLHIKLRMKTSSSSHYKKLKKYGEDEVKKRGGK